jgi:hypothetical protein
MLGDKITVDGKLEEAVVVYFQLLYYYLYKDLNIVRVIKVTRLRWLGHLVRMEENLPCKKITFSQPESSRKKGRPKLRWLDSLKRSKVMKVEIRWRKARDRNIWGRIIKKPRSIKDCRARGIIIIIIIIIMLLCKD